MHFLYYFLFVYTRKHVALGINIISRSVLNPTKLANIDVNKLSVRDCDEWLSGFFRTEF